MTRLDEKNIGAGEGNRTPAREGEQIIGAGKTFRNKLERVKGIEPSS